MQLERAHDPVGSWIERVKKLNGSLEDELHGAAVLRERAATEAA